MNPKSKSKVIKLTPEHRSLLVSVAKKLKGRVLFPKQVEEANRLLSNVTFVFGNEVQPAEKPE